MRSKILSRTPNEVVSLVEAKYHARIEGDYDDSLVESYVLACYDIAQKETNRAIFPSVALVYFDDYRKKTYLPYGEVRSIVSVTAKDQAGEVQTLPVEDYTLTEADESITISDLYETYTDFQVTFDCGYTVGNVPTAIRQGILMMLGTLYNVREDVSYGVQAFEVPITSKRLFNLYRIHTSG